MLFPLVEPYCTILSFYLGFGIGLAVELAGIIVINQAGLIPEGDSSEGDDWD